MDSRRYFSSSTLMGKQQHKKVCQLLQSLIDSNDSFDFRTPVDYVAFGLLDYPLVVKRPMDLGTVKKILNGNGYETVQACLADIQLTWDNCKTYNTADNWIYKQADKLEKMTKKMIRNYVPFVKIENPTDKRRGPHRKDPTVLTKKPALKVPQPEPKDYLQKKQGDDKMEDIPIESQFARTRKEFLLFINLCTPEQVGVIFMLLNKHAPQSLEYDEDGNVRVNMQVVSDSLLSRLADQLDMWGKGYAPIKKK